MEKAVNDTININQVPSSTSPQHASTKHLLYTQDESTEVPENTVTAVLQKGYKYEDKLLRPALVKVRGS